MDGSAVLAKFVSELKYEDLPEEVVEWAKLLLLDQLGCEVSLTQFPWAQAAYKYALSNKSSGESTVRFFGDKLSAQDAAFANSVFGHSFEIDDEDILTTSHPGVAVIPTVMAVGEEVGATGEQMILAMVAGYETFSRFCASYASLRWNGFHPTGVGAAFGTVAAAAKLYDLDEATTREAFAIATAHAGGNAECTNSGGTVKRTLPGAGVACGLRAVALARFGFTGPANAFSGSKAFPIGICTEEPDLSFLETPFTEQWRILTIGPKAYCCCAGTHSIIDACEILRGQMAEKGYTAEDIDHIVILQNPREFTDVGGNTEPQDVVQAQFSGRFSAALRLVKGGNGPRDYTMETVNDPLIRELTRTSIYEKDEDHSVLVGDNAPSRVTLVMKDGTEMAEQVNVATGLFGNPMTKDQVIAKYKDMVDGILPADKAEKLVEVVLDLEHVANAREVAELTIA